ncbi:hypothetical protein LOTGIDRAFT_113990 [Lottia gigantea]|uniref:Guanine deaminase n=1 Tax=Lottia gigantea TaxID=225164 RepID=V4AYK6_LOTGI|nr:hypothetical protein LOTGIDRAFT_113990 [Lottia gigantea]ESO98756.1 hypothetical protein LOTGIDRAFT_113990 [Lottia gigantea]
MTILNVICGTIIHSTKEDNLVILQDAAIGFQDKKIVFLCKKADLTSLTKEFSFCIKNVEYLSKRQFLIPGFVDTHAHASQYSYQGTGMDRGLMDWLNTYTFPVESKFQDKQFATDVYQKAVSRFLKNGTTTASYYGTIHTDCTLVLCRIIDKLGQRALVGKVNMNQRSPDYYVETTDQSISETNRFVEEVLNLEVNLVTPCITPRFALSCSLDLQEELGKIAQHYNLPIQTHLSECLTECSEVKSCYPDRKHYIDVYHKAGLLSNRTVLAHSIYLSDNELQIIKDKNCGIAHCPNSNLSLRSGLFDARKVLELDIKLGLGSDIAGGYSCSILDAIRSSVEVSHTIAILNEGQNKEYKPINFRDSFKMATLGGAQVLGLDDKIGNFEVGKEFDALLVDVELNDSNFDVFESDTFEDIFQKFIYLGDDRNIKRVYISGSQVKM